MAVPRVKHSARFGQRASSHTVTSRSARRRTRNGRAAGASGLPFRAHREAQEEGDPAEVTASL